MRKAIVCMGIGGPYEAQLWATEPFRRFYAEKFGWDLVNITELDPRAQSLEHIPFGQRTHLSKLLIPSNFRDAYDLILFVEADTLIHPGAPDIRRYADQIPAGGFAGCESWVPQERWSNFGWTWTHYTEVKPRFGETPPEIPDENLAHNGGVMLYKPDQVADRWLELFNTYQLKGISDEHLLSIFEVQPGRFLELPREWNAVWMYTKQRQFYRLVRNPKLADFLTKAYNRKLWRISSTFEKNRLKGYLDTAHIHHFAFEGHKTPKLASAAAKEFRKAGYSIPDGPSKLSRNKEQVLTVSAP